MPSSVRVPRPPTAPPADLVARDLTFSWGPRADPVVDGLDLTVADGEHLAVVGPSGIGKSTLAALLAGLETPARGRVELRPPGSGLRRHVLLVPQQAYVFTGTLRDNLAYLAPGADDEQLRQAARAVGLSLGRDRRDQDRPDRDRFGRARSGGERPDDGRPGRDRSGRDRPGEDRRGGEQRGGDRFGGDRLDLDQLVGPGLSAGEKQLVALTRTWLSGARLIVLDELGCHLDPAAEARAERTFRDRPGSLIVVAHRMSSAERADRVLFLDGGAPAIGTHDQLTRDDPRYSALVDHWRATT